MKRFLWMAVLCLAALPLTAMDDVRLLRFPDVSGNQVVFVYAGDIWTVGIQGGEAKRLTSHEGLELFPKLSPDGKWIAFSGEYSGSRQIYVMPATGGEPRQMTWFNDVGVMPPRGGFDYIVMDWTPDSKGILIRANRTPWGERMGRYFVVSMEGGLETPLAIPEAGFGSFSPDGKQICYAPISREFRTWKRYKGGRAADIWTYNLVENTSKRLTTFPGTDQIPHWYGNAIYFASDRDEHQKLNIWRYDLGTEALTEITTHDTFDVMWPSGTGNTLAYENGGYIYLLDLDKDETRKLSVNLEFDNPNVLPYYRNVSEDIHSMDISPTGKRAVFDARGDIFTVPAEHGITRNITDTEGVREIYPAWSPDGKWIAYCSDVTGEYEIYLRDQDGKGKARQLTQNGDVWKFPMTWSPDGKWLLFADKAQRLNLLNVNTTDVILVDKSAHRDFRDYSWGPDSQTIVYTKISDNGQSAVWFWNLKDRKSVQLTGDTFNDYAPAISVDGKYLYFISDRDFNLEFSDFEFDYLYDKASRIYGLPLTKKTPALFPDENDEEPVKADKDDANGDKDSKPDKGKKDKKAKKAVSVVIEPDGAESRIVAFPLKSGGYWGLNPVKDGLIYHDEDGLHKYDVSKKKDTLILKGVRRSILAAGGDKVLYRQGPNYVIAALKPGQKPGEGKLDLSDMTMKIDPRVEWKQIYMDGWRIFRDWFYADNLHGVDWVGMREKYAQLLPSVSHRADLDYIFGELVGEVNVGHAYVNWGDFPRVKRMDTGLLGCEFKADSKAGRFVIDKIFPGENWNKDRVSPLTEQGVDVQAGDYLLKIDGHDVTTADNPYRYLENTVGRQVALTVSANADGSNPRTSMVKPIKSDLQLRYLDWVESRRKMVDELSGGRIGYIHVPNTSFEGNRELFRGMYAYHNKDALIIDDRYNGGGFIPDVMTGLLERTTLSYWARRGVKPNATPGIAHDGPKAMLINHYSSSGGDAFPYYFKKRGLGTLIGTRTWGGLVGLSGNAQLVDGGSVSVPTFGVFDLEGNWVVEGIGIYPDIEVYDRPEQVAAGHDPCIEKAVEVLLKELEEKSPVEPELPAMPDRSGWHEGNIE